MTQPNLDERLLRLKEVKNITGLSTSGIYKLINEGKFPTQLKITEKSVAWSYQEMCEWIESKRKERELS